MSGGQITCELCGEKYVLADVINHLRRSHPEAAAADSFIEPELLTPDDEPAEREVARLTIVRRITDDDILDYVEAVDTEGDDLPLTEALGMLRLAEDTLIRERMEGEK